MADSINTNNNFNDLISKAKVYNKQFFYEAEKSESDIASSSLQQNDLTTAISNVITKSLTKPPTDSLSSSLSEAIKNELSMQMQSDTAENEQEKINLTNVVMEAVINGLNNKIKITDISELPQPTDLKSTISNAITKSLTKPPTNSLSSSLSSSLSEAIKNELTPQPQPVITENKPIDLTTAISNAITESLTKPPTDSLSSSLSEAIKKELSPQEQSVIKDKNTTTAISTAPIPTKTSTELAYLMAKSFIQELRKPPIQPTRDLLSTAITKAITEVLQIPPSATQPNLVAQTTSDAQTVPLAQTPTVPPAQQQELSPELLNMLKTVMTNQGISQDDQNDILVTMKTNEEVIQKYKEINEENKKKQPDPSIQNAQYEKQISDLMNKIITMENKEKSNPVTNISALPKYEILPNDYAYMLHTIETPDKKNNAPI